MKSCTRELALVVPTTEKVEFPMVELSSGEEIVTSSLHAAGAASQAVTFTLVDPSIRALSKSETTTLNVPSFVKERPFENVFAP